MILYIILGIFIALTAVGVISSYYDRRMPVPRRNLSPTATVGTKGTTQPPSWKSSHRQPRLRERVGDLGHDEYIQ